MDRTSLTHPLRIDAVDAGRGRIGLTFCPGKHQADAATGSWSRDLGIDLARIEDWGAEAVVTLLERHEMDALRVPSLGDEVEARGIDWYHVPIPDAGVPGWTGEARWFLAAARLREVARRGGSVVLHCMGGLGRTGMMAARFLVELGEQPAEAIRAVRQARPGSIETREQEKHVSRSRPSDDSGQGLGPGPFLGCLVGGAVGDAFGYAIEFDKLDRIRESFGPRGLQAPRFADGRLLVSDDTQMVLFTAEGLLSGWTRARDQGLCSPPAMVWYAYRRWRRTQGYPVDAPFEDGWLVHDPALQHRRAPGNTCLSALGQPEPPEDFRARNDSKGCGGVMRVAPVGLLASSGDARWAFDLASDCAGLTHGHPSGYLAAGAMAAIIREIAGGREIRPATEEAMRILSSLEGSEETRRKGIEALALAEAREVDPQAAISRLGEGWVAEEALAIGLYAALVGEDFAGVIRLAANHDGDSDSTASIAAQIYGARHGITGLPQSWIRRLDVLDPLLVLAHDLWAVARSDEPMLADYPPN